MYSKSKYLAGIAFRDLRNVKLFPSVGMKKQPGAYLRVNFGQSPFIFDIDGMMAVSQSDLLVKIEANDYVQKEKLSIEDDIRSTSPSDLDAPFDETGIVHELVAQFLDQDGYVETAQAFAQEFSAESKALQDRPTVIRHYIAEEDLDAINRQRMSLVFWLGLYD